MVPCSFPGPWRDPSLRQPPAGARAPERGVAQPDALRAPRAGQLLQGELRLRRQDRQGQARQGAGERIRNGQQKARAIRNQMQEGDKVEIKEKVRTYIKKVICQYLHTTGTYHQYAIVRKATFHAFIL